jgi:hypothetical protein
LALWGSRWHGLTLWGTLRSSLLHGWRGDEGLFHRGLWLVESAKLLGQSEEFIKVRHGGKRMEAGELVQLSDDGSQDLWRVAQHALKKRLL